MSVIQSLYQWHERWLAWLAYNLAWQPKSHLIVTDLLHSTYVLPWTFITQPTISAAWWRTRSYAWIVGHLHNGAADSRQARTTIGFAHFVELPLALFLVVLVVTLWRRLWRYRPLPAEKLAASPFRVKLRHARHEKHEKERIAAVLVADERREAVRAQMKDLASTGWFSPRGWSVGLLYGTKKMVFIPWRVLVTHVQVVGGTGSGKTASQLARYAHHEANQPHKARLSGIFFDPKPGHEVTRLTAATFRRRGWRLLVWDPTRGGSMRYNSLGFAVGAAQVRAHMLQWAGAANLRHPHYREQAADILTGVALLLRAEALDHHAAAVAVTMGDVAAFIDEKTEEEAVDYLSERAARSADPALRRTAAKLRALQGNRVSREAVMRGVRDCLVCLDDPQVRASMNGQDFVAADFVEHPTIMYAAINMDAAHALRPVVATFLTSAVTELTRVAHGKRLSRRVVIALDEFANMGQIDQMEHIASTVRALGIALLFLTQGPRDVLDTYGRSGRRLLANVLTTVVLARTPIESLKLFVEPGLDLDLARLMERGTGVVIRSGESPIRIVTKGWYTTRTRRVAVWWGARTVNKETLLRAQAISQGTLTPSIEGVAAAAAATTTGAPVDGGNAVAADGWAGGIASTDASIDGREEDEDEGWTEGGDENGDEERESEGDDWTDDADTDTAATAADARQPTRPRRRVDLTW